jgi:hypothetical protein
MGTIRRRSAARSTAAVTTTAVRRCRRRAPLFERLEHRYLYAAGWDIVLIDATLPDATGLAAAFALGPTDHTQVIAYDGERESASNVLDDVVRWARDSGHSVASISLLAHAAPGRFELGNDIVSSATLDSTAAAWQRLAGVLDEDARIALYGCDLAAPGSGGRDLVNSIARLTSADLFASADLTGRGGDWVLEATSSPADGISPPAPAPAPNEAILAAWEGTLAIPLSREVLVNTTTSGSQITSFDSHKSVAVDASGNFVVVWSGNGPGDATGIYAQRYNAAGAPVGAEFRVNSTTANVPKDPAVACESNGDFVVTWTSRNQDAANSYGIYAQRYTAAGATIGGEFRVNTTVTNDQTQPSVAMDADGDFVVAWTSNLQDGNGLGVIAQRFSNTGAAVGSELVISSSFNSGNQQYARVAMDSAGNWVIVWQTDVTFTSSRGIFMRRYNAAGTALTDWEVVNTTTSGFQQFPAIAMNGSGEYVVAWTSDTQDGSGQAVYAQRFSAAGVKQGTEFRVNVTTAGDQQFPSVAVDDSGNFVIAWQSAAQDGSGFGVYSREYTAAGAPRAGESLLNATTAGDQSLVSVGANRSTGDFVAVWSGNVAADADGVVARWFTPRPVGFTVTPTSGAQTNESSGAATFSVVLTDAPTSNVTVAVSSSDTTEGTVSTALLTFTAANWNVPQTVTVTGVDDGLVDGNVAYSIVLSPATSNDRAYSGLDPADVAVTGLDDAVEPPALGSEFLVNTTVADTQNQPAVATDASGNYVVVWTSRSQDGSGKGVYARLYHADGTPLSGEILVNTTTADDQDAPAVAMAPTGEFVIAWASKNQDGSGKGVYAQRFSAAGAKVGGEFLVNVTTADNQEQPTVAMAAGGQFVIAWKSAKQDGSSSGVYARRFDATGASLGGEFLVNSLSTDTQDQPAAAMNATGGFVITWKSNRTDGSGAGVFARLYNAAGAPVGLQFQVNTTASSNQDKPTVAMNVGGSFVIAWASMDQDGDRRGVYARRYNAAGTAISGEFLVNTIPADDQDRPTIAMSDSGTFAIAWASRNQDGDGKAIWVRHYDASGTPLGSAQVNTTSVGNQDDPAIAMDASGDFVVVWQGNGVGDAAGVFGQLYRFAGITVWPISGLTTTESGGTATFTVVLNRPPAANVTINLSSSDLTEGTLSTTQLIFTPANWNTPQAVTVTGVNDPTADGTVSYTVVTAAAVSGDPVYNGINPADVSVANLDDDVVGIAISPTSGLVTTEAGGTASFTAVLTSAPSANVTISLSTSDATEGTVSASSLTFTPANWNVPRTVTVTGVNDSLRDGNVGYTIVTGAASSADSAYNGMNPADVSVTNADDDSGGITVTPTSGLVTTETGGTATFTVVLTTAPLADVTVGLSTGNAAEGILSSSSLVFTAANWNVPQTVTITGVDDGVADGDVTYVIDGTVRSSDQRYDGIAWPGVAVTNVHRPPAPAPVAADDSYQVDADSVLSARKAAGVLRNDSDLSGAGLTAMLLESPQHGTLTLSPDGSFTYAPDAGYSGTDRFTYAASDGTSTSAPAAVTIEVRAAAPVPIPPPPTPRPPPSPVPPPPDPAPIPDDRQDPPIVVPPPRPVPPTDGAPTPAPAPNPGGPDRPPIQHGPENPDAHGPEQPAPTGSVGPGPGPGPGPENGGPDGGEAPDVPTIPGTGLITPVTRIASASLSVRLDAMARQMGSRGSNEPMSVKAVRHTFVAITVGYVVWSLRGASLIASLLTSMPLWRSLDPLPILENRIAMRLKRKRRREEKEAGGKHGKPKTDQALGEMVT